MKATPPASSQLYRTNGGTADLALHERQRREVHRSRWLTDGSSAAVVSADYGKMNAQEADGIPILS